MTDEERESKQGSIDIRKLPGYEVNIRLTSFIDAILVCNANAVSFRKWHDKINTPALVVMLKEPANYSLRHETNLELQRQFSNFLMRVVSTTRFLFLQKMKGGTPCQIKRKNTSTLPSKRQKS